MRPALSSDECLSLHIALLWDTIEKLRKLQTVLYLSGSGFLPFAAELETKMQCGTDLGERMLNAFTDEFREFAKVVIVGIDSPTVPLSVMIDAFEALNKEEIVLGPSEDGGYYLIGLNKVIPEMFHDIDWGTSRVLNQTLQKISNRNYRLLDTYFDVDTPADLSRLRKELEHANDMNLANIRAWIADNDRRF